MLKNKYNVIDEPWIPLIDLDGNCKELGLRDVLLQAHTVREIRDPMPTVEFGLYRLLTALVLDIHDFGGDDLYTLGDRFDNGSFDEGTEIGRASCRERV